MGDVTIKRTTETVIDREPDEGEPAEEEALVPEAQAEEPEGDKDEDKNRGIDWGRNDPDV